MITLEDTQAARERIREHVRRTPLLGVGPTKEPATEAGTLYLKLENLQVSGSFKARGAVNKLLSLSEGEADRGIVTASGGNHGLGVAYAAWLARTPATIYLPKNAPPPKAKKLRSWDAHVIYEGAVWDDANEAALAAAEGEGLTYIHPFADPGVIAGQGTIGLEILEALPNMDTMLVAIGGGGLISGVSLVAKAIRSGMRVIGVEPVGAPTLHESLAAGRLVTLPEIRTAANTLAPRQSAQINLEIIRENVDEIVLVTDDEMRKAAEWLWFETGVAAELSGAAALAPLLTGKVEPARSEKVCVLISGTGTAGLPRNML